MELSLLVAKAIPRTDSILDARQVKSIFGYRQSTYLPDTKLRTFGLIKETREGWLITGLITEIPLSPRLRRELNSLPGWQKKFIKPKHDNDR